MIYRPSNFEILLEEFECSEQICHFRDVNTVASITDDEFWAHYNEKKSEYSKIQQLKQSFHKTQQKPIKRRSKIIKVRLPTSRNAFSEAKNLYKRKQTKQYEPYYPVRTSTPQPPTSSSGFKSVHFDQPNRVIELKLKKPLKSIKNLRPVHSNLLDLIPVDVDALDLELDRLFLDNKLNDDSSEDSISFASSDSDISYHTCNSENMDVQVNRQPVMDTTTKPGVKLDWLPLQPPSWELISSMPATTIYKCDKPRCGFTTSNPTHIKLHFCARSQRVRTE